MKNNLGCWAHSRFFLTKHKLLKKEATSQITGSVLLVLIHKKTLKESKKKNEFCKKFMKLKTHGIK